MRTQNLLKCGHSSVIVSNEDLSTRLLMHILNKVGKLNNYILATTHLTCLQTASKLHLTVRICEISNDSYSPG